MESTTKIIRKSLHTFLRHFNHLTSIAFLALPFSTATLLSATHLRHPFSTLSAAAGFPKESESFSIPNLNLSETIATSLLLQPFTLTSLLFTKSFTIKSFNENHTFAEIYSSVLRTQIWNTLLIISANITSFWVIFIAFNCLKTLHIPSLFFTFSSEIAYSVVNLVTANATILCNLALIISGMELNGGGFSILKSWVMIRGRASTALSVSLPVNIGFAGIEALFRFRVVKAYSDSGMNKLNSSMVLEGLFIAYLYSILIILEIVIGCVFFKNCKRDYNHRKNIGDQEASWINELD